MKQPDAILVRHFASPLNEKKISRGWLGVGIDKELAETLAPGVAETLKKYGVTKIISSDLPRATQSAKLIADQMDDVAVSSTRKLRTWNTGDMAGEKEAVTLPKRQKFIKYQDETPPGGESFETFVDRFSGELKQITQPNTAFVAHGHHLLAAPEVLSDKDEVDPKKLPSLDEDFPPAGVYGFFVGANDVEVKRLDKETKDESASD
jgi:broad specificity phosphatase PhoE